MQATPARGGYLSRGSNDHRVGVTAVGKGICSQEGCERQQYGRGVCNLHYQRWRAGADIEVADPIAWPTVCAVADCGTSVLSKGLCAKHYSRVRKHGSVDPIFPKRKTRPRASCTVDGCDKPRVGRGWCSKHWTRWKRYGSPTARMPGEIVDGKRVCSVCEADKPLADYPKGGGSWCRACFNQKQLARKNATYIEKLKWPAICYHCGGEFMANKRRSIFCSRECFAVGKHTRGVKHTQARRARLAAVTVEPFLPSAVYERDDWTCGLCGEPIDQSAKKPHPKSPSIDHVIPIILGGEHSLRNVQAAHLGCNVRKGGRLVE